MNRAQKLSPRAQIALVAGGVVVMLLLGYFLLVSPQKGKASSLSKQIDATNAQILTARALSKQSREVQPIKVASLFRLTKAMPDDTDMAGILLQLNLVASQAGISFDSIQPGGSSPLAGYQVVPITLAFTGNYYGLVDFLLRLRNLVDVQNGELDANGRLFSINTLSFAQAKEGFPQITATLVVNAYVYGTGAPATAAPPAAATTTSTEPSPTDASAASGATG
ncbi:MAG TPA: type 4a pilus biogenesis protein PilO [Gaiellaceae bacterium]|nr:type 4a pilus biogenesis protein PilO [Gaiellaceae bacterium]